MFNQQLLHALPQDLQKKTYAFLKPKRYHQLQTYRSTLYRSFDRLKCIFIHIPKTAGISICTNLFENFDPRHITVGDYQVIFSKENFDNYFKFTFVRNPWERLYSAYNFLKKGGINKNDKVWAEQNLYCFESFEDFVKKWVNKENIQSYIHFRPQYQFICLPFKNKPILDFLGFYENLQEDFSHVQMKILGKADKNLTHHNKTSSNPQSDYRDFYSDKTKRIIAEVYREDIRMLGYNFDNSSLPTQLKKRAKL
jgi:Sulfotransferase family